MGPGWAPSSAGHTGPCRHPGRISSLPVTPSGCEMRERRCRNRIAVPEAWGAGGGGRSLRCFVRMTSLPRCGTSGRGTASIFFLNREYVKDSIGSVCTRPRTCTPRGPAPPVFARHLGRVTPRCPATDAPSLRLTPDPGDRPSGKSHPAAGHARCPGPNSGSHDARSLRVFSPACAPRQCKSQPLLFTNVCRLEYSLQPR